MRLAGKRAFGGIDVLVNNAGIIVRNASVTSVSVEDWERLLNVDLTGVFLVSRFALLEMVRAGRGGSIVHVSSVAGIVGDPKLAPYNAAKGGVNLLTKNMALDYAPDGIRVNAVCPGRIWTPMPMSRLTPEDDPNEILARWGKNIPLGRVGMPEDVARAILFLASDESSWITGTWLVVDGGAPPAIRRSASRASEQRPFGRGLRPRSSGRLADLALRQAEHPLADDVALDLARAGRDRV